MNVLVANAKSPPSLSAIRSLGSKNIEVTGASDRKSDFPLFSRYCKNRIYLSTHQEDVEGRINELLQIVRKKHFDVFIPIMRENLLLALLKRKSEFEKYTKIPFADYEQFKILSNKAEVSKLLAENEIPGPKTYLIDSESKIKFIRKEIAFPFIIKPFRGEGAEGVKIVTDPSELDVYFNSHIISHGPYLIQEFIKGIKHAAVFLVNRYSEPRRLFVHRALREYPISGGPTCFLESIKYDLILEYGLRILRAVGFYGMVEMEFVIDERDAKPKIFDINPRFYGCIQCAIAAGVDLPYELFRMATAGDIEADFSYREGVTCRHLLFEDTKHMIDVMRGVKSPKYTIGKTATLLNYLKFYRYDSDFILSWTDLMPAIRKIFFHINGDDY